MPVTVKVLGASVPIAAISLVELGERIVLVAAVIGVFVTAWTRVLRPMVEAAHRAIAFYQITPQVEQAVEVMPELLERIGHIEQTIENLEYVGKIVDVAADEHSRAMKHALEQVSSDRPQ